MIGKNEQQCRRLEFRAGSSASTYAQRTRESNRAIETGESSETRFVKKRRLSVLRTYVRSRYKRTATYAACEAGYWRASKLCRAREGYRDREPVWLGTNAYVYMIHTYIYIYIDIRALRIFVHNDTIYTCTDAASCQGVRVERAQRVQDNLMGNNHDTHRIAHTPPWPRSDCRNAGLYFLRMRTINHQLRTVLTHPTLPFSRIFLTLSFSFALFLLLFDTANWKRLGTETFANLALSVTSMMSTKFTKNLLELISKQTYTWC